MPFCAKHTPKEVRLYFVRLLVAQWVVIGRDASDSFLQSLNKNRCEGKVVTAPHPPPPLTKKQLLNI